MGEVGVRYYFVFPFEFPDRAPCIGHDVISTNIGGYGHEPRASDGYEFYLYCRVLGWDNRFGGWWCKGARLAGDVRGTSFDLLRTLKKEDSISELAFSFHWGRSYFWLVPHFSFISQALVLLINPVLKLHPQYYWLLTVPKKDIVSFGIEMLGVGYFHNP